MTWKLAIALFLISVPLAGAASPKKSDVRPAATATPRDEEKIDVPEIEEKRDEAPAKAEPQRKGTFQGRPFEAFSTPDYKVDQALQLKIQEEIGLLKRIARQAQDVNQRADVLFRIAELHWLQARSKYFREMEAYDRQFQLYNAKKRKTRPVEPKFNGDLSFKIYKTIIASAPKYERIDEVLFLAGYHATEVGSKDAITFFQKLVTEHPKSKFRLDSYMEIGDYYFSDRQFQKAIDAFSVVLREPSKIYDFALYKLAWCYYNQSKVRPAMNIMQKVVGASKGIPHELELREEALRDLVLFYSDLGLVDEAREYFVSIGEPQYGNKVLQKLSNIYFEQARYEKAIETLKKLLASDPLGEDAPKNYSKLIECYEKSNKLALAMNEMEQFISMFDTQSLWFKRNTDTDAREYAYDRSEVYARFLPKKYHELGQKEAKSNPAEATKYRMAAMAYYRKYLDRFGSHKNAYDMRFLYAELLFKGQQYEEAAREFDAVVRADKKGRRRQDALVGMIDALTRLEEVYFKDLEKKGIKAKDKYDPIPLSTYAERLIQADEAYVASFPKDSRVPDTMIHRAQLLYNYNQLDRALSAFNDVVKAYPESPASNTARNLILDIYNIRKDWVNLEKTANLFLTHKTFATPENRAFLLKLIQGSMFQRAKQLEEKKEYAKAAEAYMRLHQAYPDSEYADKALFNASIAYINADNSDQAMKTAQLFLARYPKSEMVPKMMLALASYFDDKLDYRHAAQYYELLAEKDPKSPFAADALFNAGLYRENLGDYTNAIKNYETYLQRYPKAKDAGEIYFSMGLVYEKLKNRRAAAEIFRNYPNRYGAKKDRVIEAYYRLGQQHDLMGQPGPAIRAYTNAVVLFRKYNTDPSLQTGVGAKYAAKSAFEKVQPDFEEFDAIKLRMPQRALANAIERKALLLKQLKNRYLEIIGFGDAETGVAALYQIGLIYQKFSQALFKAPIPPGLTPEQLQMYQQELQNRAAPIEENAVEAYEKAVKKAFELDVYTPWTKKAYDRLTQYKPDVYPPARGYLHFDSHVSEPVAPFRINPRSASQ